MSVFAHHRFGSIAARSFLAIRPARAKGAALALPYADTFAMQLHLDGISRQVAEGAQAVLLLDRAGWHTTTMLDSPKNITPIPGVPLKGPHGRQHVREEIGLEELLPGLRLGAPGASVLQRGSPPR